ncbi:cysteine hydrolase family protein [Sneathiella marina]|uniref:Cysteine hydrolase family protein n=1 Tax=Sneathiella marina TaxID=2950108 RepID=A0ABY4W9S3_9PROT|nr:cysteine hydrolase family protein [Sneathiella marina]USG62888.1 cysteine hydrolase family protein [Sneathiella marina]
MWIILGTLACALVAGAIYTLYGMHRIGVATSGEKIDRSQRPNTALLIIDMQKDFTHLTGEKAWDTEYLEDRIALINTLAADAKKAGQPVITIRQIFAPGYTSLLVRLLGQGRGATGSAGLDLDDRLTFVADADFTKHIGDAFSSPALNAMLDSHRIGHVKLAGLDGNYCVKNTAEGAVNRGYDVDVIYPAVLSSSLKTWEKQKQRLAGLGVQLNSL